MAVSVTHGGDPIPKSPFHISVAPTLDIGKVKVDGLDTSKLQTQILYSCMHREMIDNCNTSSI